MWVGRNCSFSVRGFFVLEVFGTLDGGLKRQSTLGDLVKINARGNSDCASDSAALVVRLRRSVCLNIGFPTAVDELVEFVSAIEHKNTTEVLDAQAQAETA